MKLHLMTHPEELLVVRLDAGTEPQWDWRRGPFATLTFTETETSVITMAEGVPSGLPVEGPFRVVEVAGPLAFGLWGVMSDILAPLVAAQISVLAMSTYDTDWILVKSDQLAAAREAWRKAGLIVTSTSLLGERP